MRLSYKLLPVLLCGAASQVLAQGLPPIPEPPPPLPEPPALWQVALCATTSIGVCGEPCEPFTCEPRFTMATAGESLRFDIGGMAEQPFALVAGSAVEGCQPVAGIQGALGLWAPILTVDVGVVAFDELGEKACMTGSAVRKVVVPALLPPGTDLRFQVLASNVELRVDPAAKPPEPPNVVRVPCLALSRPIEVRVR